MRDEAFTKEAAKLFPHFSRFKGFYLVGGTALALHIGHRISVDFDLFSSDELSSQLLQGVKRVFSRYPISVTYRAPDQLTLFIHNIKTTFFHYPYPLIDRCIKYQGVPVATIQEIAAMKAFAIGKRLSYKDYVDWYFLLKERHVNLSEVIAHAKKKFSGDFNDRLFLGQLVSFADIATQKIDFLQREVSRDTIENFLKKAVHEFKL